MMRDVPAQTRRMAELEARLGALTADERAELQRLHTLANQRQEQHRRRLAGRIARARDRLDGLLAEAKRQRVEV